MIIKRGPRGAISALFAACGPEKSMYLNDARSKTLTNSGEPKGLALRVTTFSSCAPLENIGFNII